MLDPNKELDRLEAQLQSVGDVVSFLNELSRLARVRRLEMDDGGLESTAQSDGKDLPPIPTPDPVQQPAEDPEYISVEAASVTASIPEFRNDAPDLSPFSLDVAPIPIPEPLQSEQSTGDFTGDAATIPVIADQEEGGMPHPPLPIEREGGGSLPTPPPLVQNSVDDRSLPDPPDLTHEATTYEASLPSDLGPLPAPPAIELPEQNVSQQQDSGVDLGVQVSAVKDTPSLDIPQPVQTGYRDEEFVDFDPEVRLPETVPVPDMVVTQEQDTSIMDQLADDTYRWRQMAMDVMTKQQEELAIQMARMYRLHALQHQQRSHYQ